MNSSKISNKTGKEGDGVESDRMKEVSIHMNQSQNINDFWILIQADNLKNQNFQNA